MGYLNSSLIQSLSLPSFIFHLVFFSLLGKVIPLIKQSPPYKTIPLSFLMLFILNLHIHIKRFDDKEADINLILYVAIRSSSVNSMNNERRGQSKKLLLQEFKSAITFQFTWISCRHISCASKEHCNLGSSNFLRFPIGSLISIA